MAMIKCRECGGDVSSKAYVCPKCGAKPTNGCGVMLAWFLGLFGAYILLSKVMSWS